MKDKISLPPCGSIQLFSRFTDFARGLHCPIGRPVPRRSLHHSNPNMAKRS
ncbi:MAG: hypothetical protein AB1656_16150 [Candidatus Omnitrophota bacterium]